MRAQRHNWRDTRDPAPGGRGAQPILSLKEAGLSGSERNTLDECMTTVFERRPRYACRRPKFESRADRRRFAGCRVSGHMSSGVTKSLRCGDPRRAGDTPCHEPRTLRAPTVAAPRFVIAALSLIGRAGDLDKNDTGSHIK